MRHPSRRSLVVLLAGAAVLWSTAATARAQEPSCTDSEATRVLVRFVGDAWTPEFRAEVMAELSVAMQSQDVIACSEQTVSAEDAAASLELRTTALPRVAVAIEVDDAVTDKRVVREIDLTAFTEDGRALALAVASDELLRASWVELVLPDAPPPRRPPPAPVVRTVEAAVEDSTPARTWFAARGAVEAFTGGEVHLGGDLVVGRQVSDILSLELYFGARRGVSRGGENGSVQSTVFGGGVTMFFHPFVGESYALGPALDLRAGQLTFEATAMPGYVARDTARFLVSGRVLAVLQVLAGAFLLDVRAGIGAPFAGATAIDDGTGEALSAASGAEVSGGLSLGVRF